MQQLIGLRFTKWIVLEFLGKFNRVNKFKVKCDCGNESISDYIALTRGKSTQCRSCARKISTTGEKNPSHKHGYSSTNHPNFKVYTAWCTMKSRCTREKDTKYENYGGRGIKICDRWMQSFENFLEDMGHPKLNESIDRIDVNGNYCPENCRWADQETQSNNTRPNVYYEYEGIKLSETQWSRKLGITRNKMMWWARKNGIEWVVQNIESLREVKTKTIDLCVVIPKKRKKAIA
jgi:hypothetical protein